MTYLKRISYFVRSILASPRFFPFILGFFIFEALWYAFSAVYPMAFDEDFHFGIVRVYASHWSPFLHAQPAGADAYGAVARDPSYLYHYLMSFPYRLLAHFVHSQTAQVLVLRVINIGLFASGILLFRKVLQRGLQSPALVNTTLAIFVLIPIVPQLAAHINYDNLLLPLTAWTCLLAYDVIEQLRRRQPDLKTLLVLLNVCLLTSLVKYAFLPIFVAVVLFVAAYAVKQLRRQQPRKLLAKSLAGMQPPVVAGLVSLTILSCGLFIQRYGVNTVRYHTPIAECDRILGYDHCSAYGPWLRNYQDTQIKTAVDANPLHYLSLWQYWLRYRLFFAINGPNYEYANYPPLTIPYKAALALAAAGLVAIAWQLKRLLRHQPFMLFILLASFCYLLALFREDFEQYLTTGQPVAINGRYLLPILPLLAIAMGQAFRLVLDKLRLAPAKPMLVLLVLLCFLQGGGIMTFILRSDASWDWPNRVVIGANNAARKVLSPVIVEGSKYY